MIKEILENVKVDENIGLKTNRVNKGTSPLKSFLGMKSQTLR